MFRGIQTKNSDGVRSRSGNLVRYITAMTQPLSFKIDMSLLGYPQNTDQHVISYM